MRVAARVQAPRNSSGSEVGADADVEASVGGGEREALQGDHRHRAREKLHAGDVDVGRLGDGVGQRGGELTSGHVEGLPQHPHALPIEGRAVDADGRLQRERRGAQHRGLLAVRRARR